MDLKQCSPKYKAYIDGRIMEYDYNYRINAGEYTSDLGSFIYITKYEKTPTVDVFKEIADFRHYPDTDEFDQLMLSQLTKVN